MGFLTDIVAQVRRDLERSPLDERALLARALATPPPRDFAAAVAPRPEAEPGPVGPAVVAEFKRASPSAGAIAEADPGRLARAYQEAGAAAVSVLTEPRHFQGSMVDLREARLACALPILRKDFLVHPAQVMESRAAGADAVLVISVCLSGSELSAMLGTAADLGLAALVETHSDEDLEKALAAEAAIVGVNARDLETLEVDEDRALELARRVPRDRTLVFESGISRREQVERAVEAGASAVLVGEALMRATDPAAKLRELLGAGVPVQP